MNVRRKSFVIISMVIMVFALFSFHSSEVEASTQQGTVISSTSLNVRAQASATSERIGALAPNATVTIIRQEGSFYEIQHNGRKGYVHKDYIRLQQSTTNPAQNDITIYVNGKRLELPISKVPLDNGSVLVPFRVIGEALGIDVRWMQATKQVHAKDGGKTVLFTLNEERTLVNNQAITVRPAPRLYEKSTVIPLRFFAETFGADVNWNQAKKEVRISRQAEVAPTPTPPANTNGLIGTVTRAETLNVRTSANDQSAVLGKLARGAKVEVTGFTGRWAQIKFNSKQAYIHSYYLDLTENGKAYKVLGSPDVSDQGQLTSVSWPKIGGTVQSSHSQSGQTITLTTDATEIKQIPRTLTGISAISYGKNTMTVKVADGYQASISHTVGELILNVSPKVSGSGTGGSLLGKKIVIDAGHGGTDPGAGANSLQEKEIVLDVALRTEKLLRNAGAHVIMTRDRDVYPTLSARVKVANDAKADLFISIHTNSATATAVGTETYWNATYSAGESKRLAQSIHKRLIDRLSTRDRGVKEGNFQVIRETKMPSVLLELAFISNKEEAEKIKTDAFRQSSAQAIYDGLIDFYK